MLIKKIISKREKNLNLCPRHKNGNNKISSTSKIKKTSAIMKNRAEKNILTVEDGENPHSKGDMNA